MTTQELKSYIDRVLGNSLRCLLPSYWWKRVFGLTIDAIDTVDSRVADAEKAIDDIVQNGTSGGSGASGVIVYPNETSERNKAAYDAIKAAIDNGVSITINSPYASVFLSASEYTLNTSTGVMGIIFKSATITEHSTNIVKSFPILTLTSTGEASDFLWGQYFVIDGTLSETSTNPVQNKVIKAYVDDAVANITPQVIDITHSVAEYLNKPEGSTAVIYVSSSIYFLDSFGTTNIGGVACYFADFDTPKGRYRRLYDHSTGTFVSEELITGTTPIYIAVGRETLSAEQIAANQAVYEKYSASDSHDDSSRRLYVTIVYDSATFEWPIHFLSHDINSIYIYTTDWDNGSLYAYAKFKLSSDGNVEFVGFVKPDDALSDTSENPVQNKAVAAAIGDINTILDSINGEVV